MQNMMKAAFFVETTLISFLLALWFVSLALRGLFHMMPSVRDQELPTAPATEKAQARTRSTPIGHRRIGSRVQQA
jgi:hypothetical protein